MIYGCTTCGAIYAPRNAPRTCPEGHGALMSMTIPAALLLGRARQDRIRATRRPATDRQGS